MMKEQEQHSQLVMGVFGIRWALMCAALFLIAEPWLRADFNASRRNRVVNDFTYELNEVNMWSAGTGLGPDLGTIRLMDPSIVSVSEQLDSRDSAVVPGIPEIDIPSTEWGGGADLDIDMDLGLSLRLPRFTAGDFSVDYPFEVVIDAPGTDSFRLGEEVTFEASFRALPEAALTTNLRPLAGGMSLDADFRLDSSATIEL